jgi:molecular chaperone DnaJ
VAQASREWFEKDYYKVLGVSDKASEKEVTRAYRKLAKQYHPDANPDNAAAAERFKEISEAYSVLSDDDKRKQYDQMRKYGAFAGMGGPGGFGGGAGPRPGPAGGTGPGGGFSFEDIGDVGGLGDLFGSIFDLGGRKRGATRPGGPQRGENVEYAVEVPFEVAVRGGKRTITVPVVEDCPTCHGSGARPGTDLTTCPECKGRGTIQFGQGGFAVSRPCPACYGKGKIPTDPCTTCQGQGQVRQQRQIQITVPAGVDTGSKIRIPGQGEKGAAGGPAGDLIVSCSRTSSFPARGWTSTAPSPSTWRRPRSARASGCGRWTARRWCSASRPAPSPGPGSASRGRGWRRAASAATSSCASACRCRSSWASGNRS